MTWSHLALAGLGLLILLAAGFWIAVAQLQAEAEADRRELIDGHSARSVTR